MISLLPYKKTRTLFVSSLLFLVLTMAFFTYIFYRVEKFRHLDLNVPNEIEEDLALPNLEKFYKQAMPLEEELNRRFVQAGNDVALLEALEEWGERELDRFEIKNVVTEVDSRNKDKPLIVEVSGMGSWEEIVGFLEDSSEFSYAHSVNKITLDLGSLNASSSVRTWNMSAIISVPVISINTPTI